MLSMRILGAKASKQKYLVFFATKPSPTIQINNSQKIILKIKSVDKIHEFYLHEFYLRYKKTKPSENDIKQYRKLRRKMLIPMIMENSRCKRQNK